MAIVVLVVGGLLTILGIAGYIYGLDLMPTERGVAGVISSSVIIVGGVLTVAMGLVLRKLEDFGKALGLNDLATPVSADAAPAMPVEAAPVPEDPIELPKIVPVQPDVAPEQAREMPPVSIEAPRPKAEAPAVTLPKIDLARPSLKTTAVVAGAATAGGIAARKGLDAVEKALSFDTPAPEAAKPATPKEPAIAPLNLPRLSPRGRTVAPEKVALRPHEVEYPVEVLKASEAEEPKVEEPRAAERSEAERPAADADQRLARYAEVPMPPPEKSEADDFEAELERLLPLKPVEPLKQPPVMPEIAPLEIKVSQPAASDLKPAAAKAATPEISAAERTDTPAAEAAQAEATVGDAKPEEALPDGGKPIETSPVETRGGEAVEDMRKEGGMVRSKPAKPVIDPATAPPLESATAAQTPPVPGAAPMTPTPAPGAEVVGAYESGGAKYTMYSDGSVIAEAEGQTMFFKSLEELREFIDGGART